MVHNYTYIYLYLYQTELNYYYILLQLFQTTTVEVLQDVLRIWLLLKQVVSVISICICTYLCTLAELAQESEGKVCTIPTNPPTYGPE